MVKGVSLSQVSMQAFRQEWSENVRPIQSAVDAITDRNINQPVFRSEWNGWLGPNFRQRKEACSAATTEDQSDGFGEIHERDSAGNTVNSVLPTVFNRQFRNPIDSVLNLHQYFSKRMVPGPFDSPSSLNPAALSRGNIPGVEGGSAPGGT